MRSDIFDIFKNANANAKPGKSRKQDELAEMRERREAEVAEYALILTMRDFINCLDKRSTESKIDLLEKCIKYLYDRDADTFYPGRRHPSARPGRRHLGREEGDTLEERKRTGRNGNVFNRLGYFDGMPP